MADDEYRLGGERDGRFYQARVMFYAGFRLYVDYAGVQAEGPEPDYLFLKIGGQQPFSGFEPVRSGFVKQRGVYGGVGS